MGSNTVVTVPDWARDYVKQYASQGVLASLGQGLEKQFPTASSAVTGDLTNPEYVYDAHSTTFAQLWSNGAIDGEAIFHTWSAAVETYTALTLHMSLALAIVGGFLPGVLGWTALYSVDGGSTWTTIFFHGDTTFENAFGSYVTNGTLRYSHRQSFTVNLPSGTNLALLRVKFQTGTNGTPAIGMYVYDLYTEGQYTPSEGSTATAFAAYSGEIIAAQTQNELDGIAALATRGAGGDLVISKATTFIDDAIIGDFLDGSRQEFIDALALVTSNSTSDFASVNSRIGKKSRFVGDPDSAFLAQSLATGYPTLFNNRISAAIYEDNYVKERRLRDHAMAYGVELGKHPAIDAEVLRQAGLAARDYLQTTYVMTHKLFLEQQEINVAKLEIFGNILRSLTGSQQSTTTTDPSGNKMAATVGMGMVGASAGYTIGTAIGTYTTIGGSAGGVYGAVIGLVVGAVVGYLTSE